MPHTKETGVAWSGSTVGIDCGSSCYQCVLVRTAVSQRCRSKRLKGDTLLNEKSICVGGEASLIPNRAKGQRKAHFLFEQDWLAELAGQICVIETLILMLPSQENRTKDMSRCSITEQQSHLRIIYCRSALDCKMGCERPSLHLCLHAQKTDLKMRVALKKFFRSGHDIVQTIRE